MQHILDYIVSYGNLSYLERQFNEVDFMALSQFAYLKLRDMVPEMKKGSRGITIKELACHPGSFRLVQENWFAEDNWKLLKLMAESERYGNILVNNYAEYFHRRYETQFQAVTFQWQPDSICVCFRGTDESVAGWKEDFNLAVALQIPGQEIARTYLHLIAKRYSGRLYVAGHSKGGNLAIYAAMKATGEIRERIAAIYNYDGPGGCLDMNCYEKIQSKVMKYVPQQSLIGMLLDPGIAYQTVKSSGIGIMQHNPYLWKIDHGRLSLCRDRTPGSRMLVNMLNKWIDSKNRDDKRAYIEKLFDIIDYPGQDSLFHLGDNWKSTVYMMFMALRDKHVKNVGK